jgi:eukaryotic-like serine/threonine-protein kinase
MPVWSPDGYRIAHRAGINGKPELRIASADGLGPIQDLPCPRPYCEPTDWTRDDALIVNVSGGDVWAVPIQPGKSPQPLLAEAFDERDARVSQDGRWIAYVSNETGRPVVSVRSLSSAPRRYVVSEGGGDQPVWRRDGKELFYVNARRLLQGVSVKSSDDGGLEFGVPRALKVPEFQDRHWGTVYDVSPDGTRVYFPYPGDERPPQEIGLLLGWRALLQD